MPQRTRRLNGDSESAAPNRNLVRIGESTSVRTICAVSASLFAVLMAFAPLTARAAIQPGTELTGNMDQPIGSKDAQVGQRFTMSHVHDQSNDIHDAVIYGHVAQVQRASQGRPGKIELAFDKLHTLAGNSYAIEGTASNVQVNTKSNALKEAAGALGGMIVGNVLGKWVGTNIGGAVGAAGGFMYAKNNRENVVIPQNAVVTVLVSRSRIQPPIEQTPN